MAWAKTHFPDCWDCFHANLMKHLEGETAERMGTDAIQLFQRGGNVKMLPRFNEALSITLDHAVAEGVVTADVYMWMMKMADRTGRDWPGLERVKVVREN